MDWIKRLIPRVEDMFGDIDFRRYNWIWGCDCESRNNTRDSREGF